jgi:hypothetical protein
MVKRDRDSGMRQFFLNCGIDNKIDYSEDYSLEELLLGLDFLRYEVSSIPNIITVKPEVFCSRDDKVIPKESVELVANRLECSINYVDGGHGAIFSNIKNI